MDFVLKNKKLFAAVFWFWVAAILYFSLTPNNLKMQINIQNNSYRLDYIFHFLVYFSLSLLFLLWKANKYLRIKPVFMIYFLVGSFILAGGSEFAQSFVPERTFNPFDLLSNILGIITGVSILFFIPGKILQPKKT